MSNIDVVIQYHDRSKHHFDSFARSSAYLDWDSQPSPYRRYPGVSTIRLPLETPASPTPFDQLYTNSRHAGCPVTIDSLAAFLRNSLAISAWKQQGENRWALRVNPSSGCLHPTEAYLIVPKLRDADDHPLLLHYQPRTHGLELRAAFPSGLWSRLAGANHEKCFLIGLSSICWRESWKYGERAFRYCQHDLGHALAALRFSAALLGWKLEVVPGFSSDGLANLLGLDRSDGFLAEEHEEPELLALVGPAEGSHSVACIAEPDEQLQQQIHDSAWFGRPNQLSRRHVVWEANTTVAVATRVPPVNNSRSASDRDLNLRTVDVSPHVRRESDASEIIQQRRSCLALDGHSSISQQGLLRILSRTLPGPDPPWDAVNWSPRLHLILFVHRVDGLAPGIYAFIRNPRHLQALQRAMRPGFRWERPPQVPPELPLYLLREGSIQDDSRILACHQDIAGDGFFSLAMLAEFAGPLRELGAWSYRNLFREAGIIGQVLYLEAEAAGARSTGIGCYFDDETHDLLGLTGHEFQDLYHFTVGMPLEDTRIRTLPAYPDRGD